MREKTLVLIPARAGSTGLKGKNTKEIKGLPLVEHTIRFALTHFDSENIVVSTDDPVILDVAQENGLSAKEIRPEHLSHSTAKTIDVAAHELEKHRHDRFESLLLLQPTSPLRKHSDIAKMQDLMASGNTDSIVSVSKVDEPHPYKMLRKGKNGELVPLIENGTDTPRQSLPECYQLAGMYYWIKVETLLREATFLPTASVPFEIEPDRAININNALDFYLCERLFQKHEF